MAIELMIPSNDLILCRPLLLPSISPSIGSFPMSQFFASVGQTIGVSASTSALPMNIQDWFPLWWTGWISLQSKGLSRVFSNTSSKASILWHSAFFIVQLSHPYMITGKTTALTAAAAKSLQSCPTLCDPMDFPVLHHLLEFAQTHVHWVGDAIQPSHPLLSPSPPTFNFSQHQGPFQWVSSSRQVATVLEFQHQSFQWIVRTDFF